MQLILVLNCGSSSVKYTLFDMEEEQEIIAGAVERLGSLEPVLKHQWNSEHLTMPVKAADHTDALMHIRDLLLDPGRGGVQRAKDIEAVGHRVVHGGEAFFESILITEKVEQTIEEHFDLAPLHNPPNLAGIRAARQFFPDVPHVAVFDTAFHQSMPERAFLYAIPYELYEKEGIRKYGFHGTSHRYVAGQAARMLGEEPEEFTGITCHLGNGCSLAAVRNGRSVDTTMGMTPLAGVPMGTRSGDVDPALIFYLHEQLDMTLEEINQLLQRKSGLLGISGVSNDLREVEKAAAEGNGRAELALDVFSYRIRRYIGSYLAVLVGTDAVILTGGIGENSVDARRRILGQLSPLGIVLDAERNQACHGSEGEISAPDSPIKLLVIPTNEELLIARDTREALDSLPS